MNNELSLSMVMDFEMSYNLKCLVQIRNKKHVLKKEFSIVLRDQSTRNEVVVPL